MINQLEGKLKERSIRPTAMRLLVLEVLEKQSSAISLTELEQTFGPSDRITLYRTLKTFEDKGLVHSINDGTGAPRYALCEEGCECDYRRDMHVHFYCRACNQTVCLPQLKIPAIALPEDLLPEEVSLVIKGLCGKCQ